MPANIDAMVREAVRAYKAGNKAEARTLLEKALEIEQYHEQAWLWLSAAVESTEDQIVCLENVLLINPDNVNAKRGLETLQSKSKTGASVDDGNIPTPPPSATASTPAFSGDFDFTSEDSSHVPAFGEDFDLDVDWSQEEAPASSSTPFTDNLRSMLEDDDNSGLELDFDKTSSDTSFDISDEPELPANSPFAEAPAAQSTASAFTDDLFGEDLFDDSDFVAETPSEEDLDRLFIEEKSVNTSSPFTADAISDIEADDELLDKMMSPSPAATTELPEEDTGDSAFQDFEDAFIDENGRLFALIPDSIKATRVPGLDEEYSRPLIISLIVLVMLNLAALVMLITGIL